MPNEELTISYINNYMDKKARQEKLKWGYNFECTCELCSRNLTAQQQSRSDMIRNKIREGIYDEHPEYKPDKMIRYMEHLYSLAMEEKLDDDSYIVGHIYYFILKSLLKVDNYKKKYDYNINELAEYAITNLSVAYGPRNVLNEFPELEEFSYLF